MNFCRMFYPQKTATGFAGHEDSVEAVAFVQSLPLTMSAGIDGKLIIWDNATFDTRGTCDHPEVWLMRQRCLHQKVKIHWTPRWSAAWRWRYACEDERTDISQGVPRSLDRDQANGVGGSGARAASVRTLRLFSRPGRRAPAMGPPNRHVLCPCLHGPALLLYSLHRVCRCEWHCN